MNLDIDSLLATGAMEGPFRYTRPRVRRNRFVEAVRVVLGYLTTPGVHL